MAGSDRFRRGERAKVGSEEWVRAGEGRVQKRGQSRGEEGVGVRGGLVAAWWSLGQRGLEDTHDGAPDEAAGGGEHKEHVGSKAVLLFSRFL